MGCGKSKHDVAADNTVSRSSSKIFRRSKSKKTKDRQTTNVKADTKNPSVQQQEIKSTDSGNDNNIVEKSKDVKVCVDSNKKGHGDDKDAKAAARKEEAVKEVQERKLTPLEMTRDDDNVESVISEGMSGASVYYTPRAKETVLNEPNQVLGNAMDKQAAIAVVETQIQATNEEAMKVVEENLATKTEAALSTMHAELIATDTTGPENIPETQSVELEHTDTAIGEEDVQSQPTVLPKDTDTAWQENILATPCPELTETQATGKENTLASTSVERKEKISAGPPPEQTDTETTGQEKILSPTTMEREEKIPATPSPERTKREIAQPEKIPAPIAVEREEKINPATPIPEQQDAETAGREQKIAAPATELNGLDGVDKEQLSVDSSTEDPNTI